MQKQNGHENLLRLNTRNQRQQIQSGRDIEDRRIGDEVENDNAIENAGNLSLLPALKLSNRLLCGNL
jgi:hypothetical protein